MLIVLIPSRGLVTAESMEALDGELLSYYQRTGEYPIRLWARNLKMPDCRNYLIHELSKIHPNPCRKDFVLWMDDDMVPPEGSLEKMFSALEESPPEVAGVICQCVSGSRGLPSSKNKDFFARKCLKIYKMVNEFPGTWCFAHEGGIAFSLWRREIFGSLLKPIFSLPTGEDNEFLYKVTTAGFYVRALPEVMIGHRYIKKVFEKGEMGSDGTFWNGLHEIGSWEECLTQA